MSCDCDCLLLHTFRLSGICNCLYLIVLDVVRCRVTVASTTVTLHLLLYQLNTIDTELTKTFSVQQFVEPNEATAAQLSDVHTSEYLDRLNKSASAIAEVSTLPYQASCDCMAQHAEFSPFLMQKSHIFSAV